MDQEFERAGGVFVADLEDNRGSVEHNELDHAVGIVRADLLQNGGRHVIRQLLGQFFVYAVVLNETRGVLELFLTATSGYEALEDDLFEVFVGAVARKSQLADDGNGLAVLLHLCYELADVLVLERERVYLEVAVANEEAVVEELRRVEDLADLVIAGQLRGFRGSLYKSLVRSVVKALLGIDYAFYILLHGAYVFRTRAQPHTDRIRYLLKSPLLALIRVYAHEWLLRAEYPHLGLYR